MKSLIILLLFSSFIIAESIDERKTDIYFANGVGAGARLNSFKQGQVEIRKYIIATPSTQKYIGKYDLAFNTGQGVIPEYFEAWLQLKDEDLSQKLWWDAFKEFLGKVPIVGKGVNIAVVLTEAVSYHYQKEDIKVQVTAYEKSIKLGHGVLVLAHSQGNFFTNKAYNSTGGITPWMRKYFITVGIASPSKIKIPHSNYLTFDNDPIHVLNGAGSILSNPKRYYYWVANSSVNIDTHTTVPCASVILPKETQPYCHNSNWNEVESDSIAFHAFSYYMKTPITSTKIYNSLTKAIEFHNSVFTPSQYKKEKQFGCDCKDKYITVAHKHDSSLDANVSSEEVLPFDIYAKLYMLDGQYVKGAYNGDAFLENDHADICYDLQDSQNTLVYQMFGSNTTPTITSGAVEVTLSWDNGADYDLELAMPNSVKDVKSCNMEHAYVQSEYEIYPGKYAINIENISQNDVNGTYYLKIQAPGTTKILSLDANQTGHIADINVKYVDNKPVVVLEHTRVAKLVFSGSRPSTHSGGRVIYSSGSSTSSKSSQVRTGNYHPTISGYSCGDKPCDYWITSHFSIAMAGPLSGADVSLYDLEGFKNHSSLYSGKTSTGDTLYTAGKLDIPEDTIHALDDTSLYIIAVHGGLDIDADDNMIVDLFPSQNHGTLHAIISGKELKDLKPKVNILTEIAYQVLKSSLEDSSLSQVQITQKLDEIASRLLLSKVYPSSTEPLANVDLLEWMPTVDRTILHASYDKQVKPIVENLLLGNDIYQSSYNLVYHSDGVVPILESHIYVVSEAESIGQSIGDIIVQYEGNSSIESMELKGQGSQNFSFDASGSIILEKSLDYENEQSYKLFVRALNADGYSKYTTIYIEVKDEVDAPYTVSFDFESVYADVDIHSKVGQIVFESGSSQITSIRLLGRDSTYFSIDTNGTIRTSKALEDFFVKKAYLFDVVAVNDSGESLAVGITINVADRRDIPNIENVYANIDENTLAHSIVATVRVVSD